MSGLWKLLGAGARRLEAEGGYTLRLLSARETLEAPGESPVRQRMSPGPGPGERRRPRLFGRRSGVGGAERPEDRRPGPPVVGI